MKINFNFLDSMSNQLLKELRLLAAFKKSSIKSTKASEKVLLLAFNQTKPLFTSPDQTEAKTLIEKSKQFIFEAFKRLNIGLEPDTVLFAQRCCSGLQFIVEELNCELSELLEGPVSGVKEYIKNCKENEIEPEYSAARQSATTQQSISNIPASHWWWFVKPLESDSE